MIAIVDYGLGNLRSVQYALDRLGRPCVLTADAGAVASADGVILPGVGAFEQAMGNLRDLRLVKVLRDVASTGRPLLGICLGLQLLFETSDEHGRHAGLGILPGQVVRFGDGLTVPHMGWNQVARATDSPLFGSVPDGAYFYFAHSYYACPADADMAIGWTDYGGRFASIVARGRVFAAQCHPEKSGPIGLTMLDNFCGLCQGDEHAG